MLSNLFFSFNNAIWFRILHISITFQNHITDNSNVLFLYTHFIFSFSTFTVELNHEFGIYQQVTNCNQPLVIFLYRRFYNNLLFHIIHLNNINILGVRQVSYPKLIMLLSVFSNKNWLINIIIPHRIHSHWTLESQLHFIPINQLRQFRKPKECL